MDFKHRLFLPTPPCLLLPSLLNVKIPFYQVHISNEILRSCQLQGYAFATSIIAV